MVYNWKIHRKTCYQLYIEEGRSLDEIMDHMKNVYNFTPRHYPSHDGYFDLHARHSKRAYQVQFSMWRFPPKQRKAHKDERLLARVKELWERNLQQKDILRILNEEGFGVNERELRRVRVKNGWLLRTPHGANAPTVEESPRFEIIHDASPNLDGDSTLSLPDTQGVLPKDTQSPVIDTALDQLPYATGSNTAGGKTSVKKSRKDKRPKDANGAMVRFPSEMTIDKAKALLSLKNEAYQNVRDAFEHICNDEGVVKKTVSGPRIWERVKDRLVEETPLLREVIRSSEDDVEAKKLALDVICTTVTKKIRTTETQMTLADLKNVLGLNPEDSRQFKLVFEKILIDTGFVNKSMMYFPEEWEALKKKAIEKAGLMERIKASGKNPEARESARALDKLAQNVRKRLKDELRRKAEDKPSQPPQPKPSTDKESRQKPRKTSKERKRQSRQSTLKSRTNSAVYEPPSRATSGLNSTEQSRPPIQENLETELVTDNYDAMQDVSHASQMTFAASGDAMPAQLPLGLQHQSSSMSGPPSGLPPPHRVLGSSLPTAMPLGSQLGNSMLLQQNSPTAYMEQQYVQTQFGVTASSQPAAFHPVPSVPSTLAMFLRLHPSSTFVTNMPMWIGTLNAPSVHELRRTAVEKFQGVVCEGIEGIVKHGGGEIPLQIQKDEELAAYLTHIQPNTPTFTVQLMWKA